MERPSSVDSRPVNVLSLAAGAGGLDLGVKLALPAARLVCAVEIEAYACNVLASRMEEGRLDDAPVWTDLRTFDGKPWGGVVDLLTAGYPCQPFSHAGRRLGAEDSRHLWPHVMRIVCECQPGLVFLENVAGHLSLGFREVRDDLSRLGYQVEAGLFAAVEAGATHRRARLYALGHRHHPGLEGRQLRGSGCEGERAPREAGRLLDGGREDAPHEFPPLPEDREGWARYLQRRPGFEPALRRDAHGMADRVDRLRLTGNGVVPQQAARAFRTLAGRLA